MIGFNVVSLSKMGEIALLVAIKEEAQVLKRRPLHERMILKKIWTHKTTYDPLVDSWIVNPDALRFLKMHKSWSIESIVEEVHKAMILNGARKDVDYKVEVFKDGN